MDVSLTILVFKSNIVFTLCFKNIKNELFAVNLTITNEFKKKYIIYNN